MRVAPWVADHPPKDGLRVRPSARVLVLDPQDRVLLFRFRHKEGPLAGQDFWSTPGGGLEDDESFEQAAIRELQEETGIGVPSLDAEVFRRDSVMQMPDGEYVVSEERFFLLRTEALDLSKAGWTELEKAVMTEHRWWSRDELKATADIVFPENLAELVSRFI